MQIKNTHNRDFYVSECIDWQNVNKFCFLSFIWKKISHFYVLHRNHGELDCHKGNISHKNKKKLGHLQKRLMMLV